MNPIPSPPATLSDHNSTAAENFSGGSSFEVEHQAEFSLLGQNSPLQNYIEDHDISTAPLMTKDAYQTAEYDDQAIQYGVMGRIVSTHFKNAVDLPKDPRLYLNTNAPFSAIVCGVQGSGKSHTVSVMLENMFISHCASIGSLKKPLAGLVLHFGGSGSSSLPCEAAWLATTTRLDVIPPVVRVFVSRSSLNTMRAIYAPLGQKVTVEPLYFSEAELDAQAFLSMMAVGSSESAPLYVQTRQFCATWAKNIHMEHLCWHSFLDKSPKSLKRRQTTSRFAAGQLTIIDLTDPFIDPSWACGLFEIVTRLFVRSELQTGKVLVVDEAHKYLSSAKASSGLTEALLSLIRQQRHLSMRVIISTQEPTVVPPVLLDLCGLTILHRFSSPSWWEHLIKHVSADFTGTDAFDQVVKLQTGQAIILAPSALTTSEESTTSVLSSTGMILSRLGRRYMIMKTRQRVTSDGGASLLVL